MISIAVAPYGPRLNTVLSTFRSPAGSSRTRRAGPIAAAATARATSTAAAAPAKIGKCVDTRRVGERHRAIASAAEPTSAHNAAVRDPDIHTPPRLIAATNVARPVAGRAR